MMTDRGVYLEHADVIRDIKTVSDTLADQLVIQGNHSPSTWQVAVEGPVTQISSAGEPIRSYHPSNVTSLLPLL